MLKLFMFKGNEVSQKMLKFVYAEIKTELPF